MQGPSFRALGIAGLFAGLISACPTPSPATEAYDPWPGLVQDIFNNRPMSDGSDVIAIEMPYRAEDAAIVPVTLRSRLSPDDGRRMLAITLVMAAGSALLAVSKAIRTDPADLF